MQENILSIRNLKKIYHDKFGETVAINDLNLDIKDKEIVAIVGPSGCGKSTLLSTVMGHPRYKINKGSIIYNDENVLEMSVDVRSKKGIFLAMQYPLEISGVKNIDFLKSAINARNEKPVSLYKFIKEVESASKEVGFDSSLISRNLNEGFSGGEKKRNEILQMKLLNPSLALIDEIDSGLDVDGLNMISNAINNIDNEKFSALIISHYSKLYTLVKPSHVHIIVDGKIVTSGDYSLIEKVDNEGYAWLEKEYGITISKEENKKQVSLGTCAIKEKISNGSN